MNNNLKKGLVAGGLIGGLLTGLFMSKKGKELRAEAMDYAEELYGELNKKAGELTELSQEKFDELVVMVVKEYGKKKEMAEDMKDEVVAALKDRWEHLQVEGLVKMLAKQFHMMEKQTKESYGELVDKVVKEYAHEKKLADSLKNQLGKELKKRYRDMM